MNAGESRARAARVRERIEAARARSGGSGEVTLAAVARTHPADVVRAATEAGVADVSESRVREVDDRVAEIHAPPWRGAGRDPPTCRKRPRPPLVRGGRFRLPSPDTHPMSGVRA